MICDSCQRGAHGTCRSGDSCFCQHRISEDPDTWFYAELPNIEVSRDE